MKKNITLNRKLTVSRLFSLLAIVLVATFFINALPTVSVEAQSSPTETDGGAAPSLGTASSFGVLAATTVTNNGGTVVNGDLGVSPGTAVTGFPPGVVNGTIYRGAGSLAGQAQLDATEAYVNLVSQACDFNYPPITDIGGLTLLPGVHCFPSSAAINGILTLDGQGQANPVFVFKIGSTLLTAAENSQVVLINGAQACNVFYQVGSSATLGTNTLLQGNILALASITATTGARLNGRAIALIGAVTMDTNAVSICSIVEQVSCTPITTVSEGDLIPGGLPSINVVSGPGSVGIDHVNAGTGTQSITVVGTPTNAVVNIPPFTPGTFNPVIVTFTRPIPADPIDFTLRAASLYHAIFIRVRCNGIVP